MNEQALLQIIGDTLWMAARYAHGRRTYAPSTVRDAVKKLQAMYPDFEIKRDGAITPPTPEEEKRGFRSDRLEDILGVS